jgi:3-dehydro-4-phosphotetronate decarboxylase
MEDIVAGIEAAVPAIKELEGTAKLFLLLRNTLVRPLNAAQIEELKAAFKMEF